MFRDEVHRVGEMLGLPGQLLSRQPFPDAGLATRIWGEATPERLDTLRAADAVWEDEITQAGLARKLSQYYAVLAQVRMCEPSSAVLLRALQRSDTASTPARLPYDLLERAVDRILKETLNAAQKTTPGVARVMYDMTPPARTGGDP
jgi:GMP synthase (glutamine-hydrolysing)